MCQGHVFGMIRVWTVFSSHRTSRNLSRKGVFKKKATLKIEYQGTAKFRDRLKEDNLKKRDSEVKRRNERLNDDRKN